MSVCKLGYVALNVMDLLEAKHHYRDVLGMTVSTETDDAVYLRCEQEQEHHSVILIASDRAGLDHIGLMVDDDGDIDSARVLMGDLGIACSDVKFGEIHGQGPGLRIHHPSGHDFLLFFYIDRVGYPDGMRNPVSQHASRGSTARVQHLNHTLIACPEHVALIEFLTEHFDFAMSEKMLAPDGEMIVGFLSCTHTMHDIAVCHGPNPGGLHHVSFHVADRAAVISATDIICEKRIPHVEYGPSRHGVSGVTTFYFHDPSGNRNEVFSGAYLMPGLPNRSPVISWPAQHLPRGAFYYENNIPETFFSTMT